MPTKTTLNETQISLILKNKKIVIDKVCYNFDLAAITKLKKLLKSKKYVGNK